jgi:hypothetical protein
LGKWQPFSGSLILALNIQTIRVVEKKNSICPGTFSHCRVRFLARMDSTVARQGDRLGIYPCEIAGTNA